VNALQIAVRIHNKNVNPKQQLGDVGQLHAASHDFRTGGPLPVPQNTPQAPIHSSMTWKTKNQGFSNLTMKTTVQRKNYDSRQFFAA
jgi:hypothetical protein